MDLDTATCTRAAYERIIADFGEQGKTDILINLRKWFSKGLDFDHVSVVGILNGYDAELSGFSLPMSVLSS